MSTDHAADPDNFLGPDTDSAIRTYQGNHGLQVDGCVGPSTWSKLQSGTFFLGQSGGCTTETFWYYRYSKDGKNANYYKSFATNASFWYTQTGTSPSGPLAALTYYRFSHSVKKDCFG